VRLQGLQVEAAGVDDDLRARHLAEVSMRSTEHAGLHDPRKLVDAALDFLREELEPRDEDDGLSATVEVQSAGRIQPADVAGQEPAVPGDLLATLPGLRPRLQPATLPRI
jgi:hypothetical protein